MPLSPHLRDRIVRQLDTLSDEKGYAVLDYVEFMASRYAQKESPSANIFTRFTEGVEDTLRAGKVSASAISQTMGLLNQAMGVLNGVAAAGKSVATDIVNTASDVAKTVTQTTTSSGSTTGQTPAPGTTPPATDAPPTPDQNENPSPS
ncbi:MAG: hypothetical protein IT359_20695 [Gemmatimonadaceae bacterium]|nr:hypothetical protein [Gemmatimonadaceae bacterium]